MPSYILGIESTAHTFAVAIIDDKLNIIADERVTYKPRYTLGIDPHEASEYLSINAASVVKNAFRHAGLSVEDIDAIAYSMGPGLGPCLRIGASIARALAFKYKKRLYPVHHALGHIELVKTFYKLRNPLVILISGGHTVITSFSNYKWMVYGETLDITLGNLLDMFAREVGLSFPGGPQIEKIALKGKRYIDLPYTVKGTNLLFSGLLTSAIKMYKMRKARIEDIAFSLQETAFSMLIEASERALTQLKNDSLALTGGVASNDRLYQMFTNMAKEHDIRVYRLPKHLNPDNGVQIAVVGLKMYLSNVNSIPVEKAIIKQKWRLDEVEVKWN